MDLREVLRTTPAVRTYTDEPVPDEVLHRILDTARFAPSGGNRQAWRVIVVKEPDLRRQLRDLYDLGNREYWAFTRAGLVPFASDEHGRWRPPPIDLAEARATPVPMDFVEHLHEAPVLLVLVADLGAIAVLDGDLDRQSITAGASVYPFAHNVLLAARNEGIGGVMTTILCRQEPAAKALLGIPEGYAIAGLLALGHPVKQLTKLRRAAVEDFTVVDRFGGDPFP